jgi:signal transduction histidine kinase
LKPLVFFLLLLLIGCSEKWKNEVTDSRLNSSINALLLKSFNANLSDSIRVVTIDKAYISLLKINNTQFKRDNLIKVVDLYYKLYENEKLSKSVTDLLKLSQEAKDTLSLAKAFNYLGKNKLDESQLDSAYYYFIKAEKIFIAKNDSINLTDNYSKKAIVEIQINAFYSSEISSIKSLNYNKNDIARRHDAYNLIGNCSNENHNYENAITYHTRAIDLIKSNKIEGSDVKLAKSYNNIGYVYQNLNNHKKAMTFFKLGLNQKEIFNKKPDLYLLLLDNYAYSKFKTKDFKDLPDLFYESLKEREKLNLSQGIMLNKLHLSEYYLYIKDTVMAKKFAVESLQLAKKIQEFDVLAQLKQLSNVDVKNAAKYSKQYIKLNDSIQVVQNKDKERFARIAYETDEVIKENQNLGRINQNLIYYIIGGFLLFIMVFVARNEHLKNRIFALKQQQQITNQEVYNLLVKQQTDIEQSRLKERNRMAKELHDGVLSRMFGIRLSLDSSNHEITKKAIDLRYNYIDEIKDVEQQIREISHNLSAKNEKISNNFVLIVIDLLEKQKTNYPPTVTYTINPKIPWDKVENFTKINLFRILQETLQNCNKYAAASTISVVFDTDQTHITLAIEDNGIGFNLKKKKRGIGLNNIYERAEESFGVFEITSEINQGTKSFVTIPITPTKNQPIT